MILSTDQDVNGKPSPIHLIFGLNWLYQFLRNKNNAENVNLSNKQPKTIIEEVMTVCSWELYGPLLLLAGIFDFWVGKYNVRVFENYSLFDQIE